MGKRADYMLKNR